LNQRDLLRIVFSNLNRMRARVALTAIGVIIGTAAVIVLISLGIGLQANTASLFEMEDLTVINVNTYGGDPFEAVPAGRSQSRKQPKLDDDALRAIRALPHVVVVTPQQGIQSFAEIKLGRKVGSTYIQGILPEAADAMGWEMQSGTTRLARGQILISPKAFENEDSFMMMRSFGGGMAVEARGTGGTTAGREATTPTNLLGKTVTLVLTKWDDQQNEITRVERLRVAGVFVEGNRFNWQSYIPLSQVEELNRWSSGERRNPREGYQEVIVKVDDPENVIKTQEAIEAMDFGTSSQQQFVQELNRSFLVVQGVLGGVGAIALLVAAFGIANTMTMAIYERTKEIGVMKAIGATNNDVLGIFLAEAGTIGLIGGVFGVGIGWTIGKVIQIFAEAQFLGDPNRPLDQAPPSVVVTPWWLIVFAISFAALVGVISGIYPALRAASMKPLRALRTE